MESHPKISTKKHGPEKYGLAYVQGKTYYFAKTRILRSDAKYGDIELELVSGTRVRVYAEEAVKRWPREAEFELEE